MERTEESVANDVRRATEILAGDPVGGLEILATAIARYATYGPEMGPPSRNALFNLADKARDTAKRLKEYGN